MSSALDGYLADVSIDANSMGDPAQYERERLSRRSPHETLRAPYPHGMAAGTRHPYVQAYRGRVTF